jgi:glycosyltransferase involved in cell wall biosynthesis
MSAVLVSACIIARDEERVLPRCLESIRDACDELCIVDTGSSDRTSAIARASGARVIRFTGCNDRAGRIIDFARARNRSLALATGRWALWIDADEVLAPRSAALVRRIAAADECDAVRVQLRNGGSRWPVIRLFRRFEDTRFEGTVHEYPAVRGRVASEPRIVIRNLPDKRGKESAVDRDLRLCRAGLRRDPHDARMRLYLARALEKSDQLDAAIVEYQEYARRARRFRAGRHHAYHRIAVCHLLRSRWKDALRFGRRALRVDSDRAESQCIIGDACLARGDYAGAIAAYRAAVACPPVSADYPMFTDPDMYGRYPRAQLTRLRAS